MARYGRFLDGGVARYGRIDGERVVPLSAAPWAGGAPAGEATDLARVQLLVPCEPTKIVLVGQNYRKHAEELGKPVPDEPLIFLKPLTALNAHQGVIPLPRASREVHHEAELAIVIGERLRDADEAAARRALWGLTCFNDVTARDIQRREVQFTRAKSYDGFACVGPWVVQGLSPGDLRIQCRVNGRVRQDSRTSDMVFKPERLVSFISEIMPLLPGDLVSTGTPSGVGELVAGDVVEVEIEGIGTLSNRVETRP